MLFSVGKGIGLYLYIAQVGITRSYSVGSYWVHVMNGTMMFVSLVIRVYELNDHAYNFFIGFLSICGIMGLHMYIAQVNLWRCCEDGLLMIWTKWVITKCNEWIYPYVIINEVCWSDG